MLFWLVYILSEALIQNRYIKKGNRPIYILLFIIRGIFALLQGAFILDVQNDPWWEWPVLLGWQVCSFWVIFDLILNALRNKDWDYKGENSGWLDTLPYKWWYTGKILAILGIVIFYIIGLQIWEF